MKTRLLAALAAVLPGLAGLADLPAQGPGKPQAAGLTPTPGHNPGRNLVNLVEKNLPTEWSAEDGKLKGVKWSAATGNRGYGSPVIAGRRVFVSTNNAQPRDPHAKGRKAVLMCFGEKDGKFLWQAVHP